MTQKADTSRWLLQMLQIETEGEESSYLLLETSQLLEFFWQRDGCQATTAEGAAL